MFGGVNALFSGLAFLGVILAILLQKRELALQRQELEQTRGELAGQREQMALQSSTFQQQSFDNTFFQMLSLHNSIVDGIDSKTHKGDKTGRDCFVFYYEGIEIHFQNQALHKISDSSERWIAAYERLYSFIQHDLGHYFRNLFHIVEFVDRSSVEDKRFYTNLIRAQLSSHELLMLFYNASSKYGREKFKPLIEKYSLLKNMPTGEIYEVDHLEWFNLSAYTGQDAGE